MEKLVLKNNGIYLEASTNRGFIAWLVLVYLVSFYLVLYFMPDYVVNWTYILDPISKTLNGGLASQWFVYGVSILYHYASNGFAHVYQIQAQ